MKKELGIVTENVILTECWNAYIIAAVLGNNNPDPWYMERFIDFYVDESLDSNYYPHNSYYYEYADNGEVVEFEDLAEVYSGVDLLRKKLDEDKYVLIYLNLSEYLEKNFAIRIENHEYLQDVMLFGYDDDEQSFDFLVMIKDALHVLKMNQDDLGKYFASACSIIRKNPDKFISLPERHLPLYCFSVKNNRMRKIIPNRLRLQINDMIVCQEKPVYNRKTGLPYYHGVKVYDIVIEAVERCKTLSIEDEERMFAVIKLLSKLFESRNNFLIRMEYAQRNTDIVFEQELMDNLRSFVDDLKTLKNRFIKYTVMLDKKILEKNIELATQCREKEYNLFNEFYGAMTKAEFEKLKSAVK